MDDDSFDYVFYSYGLRLYGNMPLIEPQEWKEVKKVEDFAIVIVYATSPISHSLEICSMICVFPIPGGPIRRSMDWSGSLQDIMKKIP